METKTRRRAPRLAGGVTAAATAAVARLLLLISLPLLLILLGSVEGGGRPLTKAQRKRIARLR